MRFDTYTIGLLLLRHDAPALDEAAANALQDAHLAHLAQLHEAGHLLAAGPVLGPPDRELRGFSILRVDPDRARELKVQDPAVRAGRFRVEVYPWMLPAGLMSFSPGRLPRSIAEASGD
ncbi:MAG TPA: YciI family protein [Candidatus Dormibacteraeota bacterium]